MRAAVSYTAGPRFEPGRGLQELALDWRTIALRAQGFRWLLTYSLCGRGELWWTRRFPKPEQWVRCPPAAR